MLRQTAGFKVLVLLEHSLPSLFQALQDCIGAELIANFMLRL